VPSAKSQHESPIAVYGALAANLGIALAKFVASFVTGSSAMLSEGIHSIVDTGNQGLLLVGIHRSGKPADDVHEFGHGKELYFWSLIVAIVLFGIGGGLAFYEGIDHILNPHPIENVLVNYVVLGIAFALEATSWSIAYREITRESGGRNLWRALRRSKDPSVVTVIAEDSAALIGLIAAFIGIFLASTTGDARWDGGGSLVIGATLTVVALFLAQESRGLLVGERASRSLTATFDRIVDGDAAVERIELIRTMHLGPDHVLVNAEVRFKPDQSDLAGIISRLERRLAEADPLLSDVTIEPVADAEPGQA